MIIRNVAGAAAAVLLACAVAAFGPHASTAAPARPTPVTSPTPSPTPNPVTVLRNAELAARASADAPYIVYDMHEIFVHHGKPYTYDYHVWYRTSDGAGLMQNAVSDRYGHHEQRFGYPFPSSPDANFLLYETPPPTAMPAHFPSPAPLASGQTSPPVLVVAPVTASRYYTVSMVGIEDYQGHPTYHLALQPLPDVDQRAHPWKDLWVDTQTFEVWKAHADASGSKGPASGSIDATVEFEPVGPYWLIAQATGDGEVHLGFISDSGHYEYYFSGFDFPNTLPDWYFDPKLFRHH